MDLKQLGFSDYEEKAYKSLIHLGKSTASKISQNSEVPYGKIYDILASLEVKGLVQVVPEKTKMFIPSDPKHLLKLVEKKEEGIASLRQEIGKMKQIYDIHEEEVVYLVKGLKNFYKVAREVPKARKFSYAVKYTSEFRPEFIRASEEMMRNGIKPRVLTRYDDETKENVKKWVKIHQNIRGIENKGVAIDINETGVMITLLKNNTTMLIKDKYLAEVMKQLFEGAYEMAEKIK
jgi:sugar-specific transcriptional regulator TrmB